MSVLLKNKMGGLVTPPGGAESPQFPTRPCTYLLCMTCLHIILFIIYSAWLTLHYLLFTLHNLLCTIYSARFTLHNLLCSVEWPVTSVAMSLLEAKPNIQCPATNSCDCTDHPPRHATLPTLNYWSQPQVWGALMEERFGRWGMRISSSFFVLLLLLLLLVTKYDKLQANKRTNLSQRVV